MKKYLSILIAMLAALPLLTACSDDDDKPTATLAPIETGDIPAQNIRLFLDGKYFPINLDATTHIEGNFNPATQYSGTLTLNTSAIFYITQDYNGYLNSYSPDFKIDMKKVDDELTFSGEAWTNIGKFTMTGEIYATESDGNIWIIRVERTVNPSDSYFIGKTFEIQFEKGNLFPNVPVGGDENLGNLCKDFFENLSDVYIGNSGYSAARIKFLDDATYELWFKDVETGEYVKDESTHRYLSQGEPRKEFTVINFIDEPSFKQKQAEYFNLKPIDILAENKPTNFAQQTMICDMTESSPMCVTTVHVITNGTGDGKLYLSWLPYNNDVATGGFMLQWTEPDPITNQAEYDFASLQQAQKDNKFVFSARANFVEVE